MSETLNFKEIKRQAKFEELKQKGYEIKKKAEETAVRTVNWALENPMQAIAALTALGTVTSKVAKIHSVNAEQRKHDRKFYDPRTGKWSEAKRNLSKGERLEIERRYLENRESYQRILFDMGILK